MKTEANAKSHPFTVIGTDNSYVRYNGYKWVYGGTVVVPQTQGLVVVANVTWGCQTRLVFPPQPYLNCESTDTIGQKFCQTTSSSVS
jgi:hypothetical protein